MCITTPNNEIEEDNDKPFCCKHCGSENFIKYGKENNKQMYKCKDCSRKFIDNMFFERMKGDPKIICLTLEIFKDCKWIWFILFRFSSSLLQRPLIILKCGLTHVFRMHRHLR